MIRCFFSAWLFVITATVLPGYVFAQSDNTESRLDETDEVADASVDISTIAPDLVVPEISDGQPAAGRRFRRKLDGNNETDVYHVVYLPADYPDNSELPHTEELERAVEFPLIVEFPGNRYTSTRGDVCTGLPDGCKLGYGISGGRGAVWVCLPFVTGDGRSIVTNWWGDSPDFAPGPTVDYAKRAVESVCSEFKIDTERIILTGFSRGAIACNFIGLHDDKVASLWRGFIPYSHYDGVRSWPYPGSDRESALVRLQRLNGRPQFVCHECNGVGNGLSATRQWIEENEIPNCTFCETGFLDHNDAWILRPSRARDQLRNWYATQLSNDEK